jgi:hypothetical protein
MANASESANPVRRQASHERRASSSQQTLGPPLLDTLYTVAGVDPVFVFTYETPMHLEDLVTKPTSPMPITVPAKSLFADDQPSEARASPRSPSP